MKQKQWQKLKVKNLQQPPFTSAEIWGEGIYVLIINDKLQYIGETENLRRRLNAHLMNMRHYLDHNVKVFIKYKYVQDYGERKELEQALIMKIKPAGNKPRRETIMIKFRNSLK